MKRQGLLVTGTLALAAGLGGFGLRRVLAEGIPATTPLFYSGVLTENDAPVTGDRHVAVNLWASGDPQTGGSALCTTDVPTVHVEAGRFRVALDAACKAAVAANTDPWVEVVVGGDMSLGRTKIGAVPYAVEANHAVTATNAATAVGDLAVQLKKVQDDVKALQHTTITVNGKKYSVGAYCGATASYDGAGVGGYSGAKLKCETTCNSVSAHECSAEEMVRSAAAGLSAPLGWVATGTFIYDSVNANGYVDDCDGYTNNGATRNGASWTQSTSVTHGPNWHGCNNVQPVLCCD